jgi:hypothetical protein
MLICLSIFAGFFSGIGLVLLIAPIDLGIRHGRRWSDHIYAASQAALQLAPISTTTNAPRNQSGNRPATNSASSVVASGAEYSQSSTDTSSGLRTTSALDAASDSSRSSQPIPAQEPADRSKADSIAAWQNSTGSRVNSEDRMSSLAEIAESLSPAALVSSSTNPPSLSQLASETDRRTKPRRPPAAIFANFQDNQTPTKPGPSKLAT